MLMYVTSLNIYTLSYISLTHTWHIYKDMYWRLMQGCVEFCYVKHSDKYNSLFQNIDFSMKKEVISYSCEFWKNL